MKWLTIKLKKIVGEITRGHLKTKKVFTQVVNKLSNLTKYISDICKTQ